MNRKGFATNMVWLVVGAIVAILVLLLVFLLVGKMQDIGGIALRPFK